VNGIPLSVIIPAHNEATYLPACLDALAKLSGRSHIECIVVDNGSTDETAAIAQAKGATVVSSAAKTIAGVRNEGAARAHGEFLAFLDADCTVQPGWEEAIVEDLQEDGVVAVGAYPLTPEENSTWVQSGWSRLLQTPGGKQRARWLPSANMAVRRDAFFRVGGFDAELTTCEDADLSYRLAAEGAVLHDPRMCAVHHREPATLAEFFRKEIWHGKDSYRRMLRGGMVWGEIPSLILPMVQLSGVALLAAGAASRLAGGSGGPLVPAGTILVLLPPLALSARAILRLHLRPGRWASTLVLYGGYTLARSVSLLLGVLPRKTSE